EAFAARTGERPKVFLANMGPIPQHKARADFSTGFLQVGGFEIITNNGFDTPEAAAQAAIDSGAPIVVICSTDPTYPEYVPPITEKIKAAKPNTIVLLAGYPADQIDAHKASGVDDFIHIRADVYQMMKTLQDKLNVA
ncbi:MAG: methylmalonyl-CoA mutase, partial [Okeania sp. SIO3B3]|nr:methylmalonyl-CoA mutase [Okeania sp. SIO3B3]